jgi:hypothetical protein
MSSRCDKLTVRDVEEIIKNYNEEFPKRPVLEAKILENLILVDNPATTKIKAFRGTIVGFLVEGRWGSGKTWSCYKIFHDLRREGIFVTYIPLRSYARQLEEISITSMTKVNGKPYLIATAIAEALIKPSSLSARVKGVLTNAPDVQGINIDQELTRILEEYSSILQEVGSIHIVLLDEIEDVIEHSDDLDILITCWSKLRELRDVNGIYRLTIGVFAVPIEEHPAYGVLRINRISEYINAKLKEMPYVKALFHYVDLDKPIITKQVLRGFVERSVTTLNNILGCNVDLKSIKGIDQAVNLITNSLALTRYGKDILKTAIAKAYIESTRMGISDLLEFVKRELAKGYGFSDENLVVEIFVKRRFSKIRRVLPEEEALRGLRESLVKPVLERLRTEGYIKTYYEAGQRTERGFSSLIYNVVLERRGRLEVVRLIFWLRVTPIAGRSLNKVSRYFGDSKIVLVSIEGLSHGPLPNNVVYALNLPGPVMYYILSGKTITADLSLSLENVLEGYKMRLKGELLSILGL